MDPIARCLEALARHVVREEIAIAGGVAMGRRHGDLDLVVARRTAIRATVCEEFLIGHHHDGDHLILQLVDPRAVVRIDVFVDTLGAIEEAAAGDHGWLVLDLDDVLDHKLALLARATAERPVDPKHADDARSLAARLLRPPPLVDPAALRAETYATDVDAVCGRCLADPAWPIAAKADVLAILGYV